MTGFANHHAQTRTKLLLVGDSGSGKTAVLATLANAGYKLRILDYDNGLDILGNYLTPEGIKNVDFHTLKDSLTKATAYKRGMALLKDWKTDGGKSLGSVKDWGSDTVLVIDSLSFLGNAMLRNVLQFNGKPLTAQLTQPEWGAANRDMENLLNYLTNDEEGEGLSCNLVLTSHIQNIDSDNASGVYPVVMSKNFSQGVSKYFNTVIRLDRKPNKDGPYMRTVADHKMMLKNTVPDALPTEMPADLSVVFRAMQQSITNKTGAVKGGKQDAGK